MSLASRVRSFGVRARAIGRLAPHLPELLPGGHFGPALLLERCVERFPNSPALYFADETCTWAELDRQANRWARFFVSRGVARGDVLVLLMDNRPEYLFALAAASKLRCVTACVNTNLSGPALAHAIHIAKPRLLVVGSEHEVAIRGLADDSSRAPVVFQRDHDAPARDDFIDDELASLGTADLHGPLPLTDEPMSYLYTSGTTGLPKAAVVTNRRFVAAARAFGDVMHAATETDVIYSALPLYHGTGQWGGFGAALATGAALALRRKFSASNFWSDIVRFGATRFLYIGELCRYLLHQPPNEDERRHRIRIAVGNGLRPDIWRAFQERFQIPLIREFYGATEGNSPLVNLEGRPGMIGQLGLGQALLECDLDTGAVHRDSNGRCRRVKDPGKTGLFVGRISKLVNFDGYIDARATESKVLRDVFADGDAWFNSGDLLTLHEDGWVAFADRVGDTFRWKGENVSTNEVAELLNGSKGVLESNVYGVVVNSAEGRAGMASLRVSPEFDLAEFAAYVTRRVPRYARPLFVRVQEDMQITATFKHQKGDYRSDGYDPAKVRDPLFVLVGSEYQPLTPELFRRIQSGEFVPG